MKQLLFSTLILFASLRCNAMEMISIETKNPSADSLKTQQFIEYMNDTINHRNDAAEGIRTCRFAINFACSIENPTLFEAALKRWMEFPDRNGRWSEGKEPSHLAQALIQSASRGNCNFLEKILKVTDGKVTDGMYCSPDAPIYGPITAIGLAAHNGHHLAVRLLLAHNADPELGMPRNGATPLRLAIRNGKLLCTQEFFKGDQKANPNSAGADTFGSILHWTLSLGNRNEHVRVLIQNGADRNLVNAKNNPHEGTPLMVAVAYANLEGVQILLAAKADISIKHPFNNLTALEQAKIKLNIVPSEIRKKIVEFLERAT